MLRNEIKSYLRECILTYMKSSYIKNTYSFFKNPTQQKIIDIQFSNKLRFLIYSFFLLFIGAFVLALINQILVKSGVMLKADNEVVTRLRETYRPAVVYLIVVLVAPIIEELAFRGFLRFSKRNLIISGFFLCYIISSDLIGNMYEVDWSSLIKLGLSAIVAISIAVVLKNKNAYKKLEVFWERKFYLIFYGSAFLFASLHFFNLKTIDLSDILFSPVIVSPFLIYAMIFGLVRLKLGLVWSISLHIILNLFVRLINL